MTLEHKINIEDCKHLVVAYDGRQPDIDGGFLEQYTCRHPSKAVPQCRGSFTGRAWTKGRAYVGRDVADRPHYWKRAR